MRNGDGPGALDTRIAGQAGIRIGIPPGCVVTVPPTCDRSVKQAYAGDVIATCLAARGFAEKHSRIARSGAQLPLGYKRYDLVSGAALSLFRGGKNCLDLETVPGGFVLANAPDLIDDRIPRHELFSQ